MFNIYTSYTHTEVLQLLFHISAHRYVSTLFIFEFMQKLLVYHSVHNSDQKGMWQTASWGLLTLDHTDVAFET